MRRGKPCGYSAVLVFCVLAVSLAGIGRFWQRFFPAPPAAVTYFCREGMLKATYTAQKVSLVLPDGRTYVLPQAPAASGIRFSDGKIEFWSKGENAFVTENNRPLCSDGVAGYLASPSPGRVVFTDSAKSFSFAYPKRFILSGKGMGLTQGWRQGTAGFGTVLALVTIPPSFLPLTNFRGAEFSIGQSGDPHEMKDCFVKPQGYGVGVERLTIHGVSFVKFTFADAGAGNLYETTSYRAKRGGACYAVEYIVHSSNIGMYPPEQGIKEFDKAGLMKILDGMARSFTFRK